METNYWGFLQEFGFDNVTPVDTAAAACGCNSQGKSTLLDMGYRRDVQEEDCKEDLP